MSHSAVVDAEVNRLCPPTIKNLLKLAIPIALGMASLSILGLVETTILGHYSQQALAANAAANYIFFIFLSAFAGFAIAVQSQVARYIEDAPATAKRFTQVGLIQLSLVATGFIALVHFFHTEMISAQIDDPMTVRMASEFLWIKSWSLLPIAILMALRGFWHGANRPRVFLVCLLFSHILAGLLCYALVYGKFGFPEYGLNGAALATLISMSLGTGLLCLLTVKPLSRKPNNAPANITAANPNTALSRDDMKIGWHLAWPTSFQQVIFAVGTALFMAIVAKSGITQLAAAHLVITLSLVLILPVIGFGMSATTFISRTHAQFQSGNGDSTPSNQWYRLTLSLSVACILIVSPVLLFATEPVLNALTNDQAVIEAAYWPLIILVFSLLFEAFSISTKQSLYALHQNKAVLKVLSTTQWFILLPVMLIIHLSGYGSLEIYTLCHAGQRAINGFWLYRIWRRAHQDPTKDKTTTTTFEPEQFS